MFESSGVRKTKAKTANAAIIKYLGEKRTKIVKPLILAAS